ncbi:MAG: lipopolysaccharide transport periplasmic protein LptA [Pseudomonadota bacterium]
MNHKYILILLLFFCPLTLNALSTDKQQDIEIEADSAELDDIKGISIYRGNVVVVQGSIRMTGDVMTVHFDGNGDMELVVMDGRPATYKQLPDDSQIYDEAEALRMEYYSLKDYVILINEALVTQEGLKFSGDRIEYDTVKSQVKARTVAKQQKSDVQDNNKEQGERVKIIIKKKKTPTE